MGTERGQGAGGAGGSLGRVPLWNSVLELDPDKWVGQEVHFGHAQRHPFL